MNMNKANMGTDIEMADMDLTNETISALAFREVSRVTRNISKETAMMTRRMSDMERRLRDLDYNRPLFY